MKSSAQWRKTCALPPGQERNQRLAELRRQFRIREYDLHAVAARYWNGTGRKKQLEINEVQKLASAVSGSLDRWLFHQGGRPRYKSARRGLHSVEGKNNKTGIIWRPAKSCLYCWGIEIPVGWSARDDYVREALAYPADPTHPEKKVKYCRIVRTRRKNGCHYDVQLILKDTAPVKQVYAPQTERMAIDLSTKSLTFGTTEGRIETVDLVGRLPESWRQMRRLQRRLDRSRRAMNPDNFHPNGTCKGGVWCGRIRPRHRQIRAQLAELRRHTAAVRHNEHGKICNVLLGLAGSIRVEENSYKAFQRGRYGKSLGSGAPAAFLNQLKNKAASAGCEVIEVNPYRLKPTQHDIVSGEFRHRELSERRVQLGQTDLWMGRDTAAVVNLLCADLANETYDPSELHRVLTAWKHDLLDAGILVEQARNGMTERVFRRFRSRSREALTADELRQKMVNSRSDIRSAWDQPQAERQSDGLTGSKPRHFSDRVA